LGVDKAIPRQDLYRELEVDPGASTETIEAAYRSLMKRHHPDRAGPSGLARTKRLNLAREWLVDRERRARYDATREAGRSAPSDRVAPSTTMPGGSVGRWPSTRTRDGGPSGQQAWRASSRTSQARPRRTVGRAMVGSGFRLGLIGVIAIAAASLVMTRLPTRTGDLVPTPPGGAAAQGLTSNAGQGLTSTQGPSATPTLGPTFAATSASTPFATASPTPLPTPRPSPKPGPSGAADLRFSGVFSEHYVHAVDGARACGATTTGGSASSPTGFEIESDTASPSKWQLTLDDLSGSWRMDIFFEATADGLWWNSGVGVGSVARLSDGYSVDVVLSDSVRSLRVRGTVTCR